MRIGHLFVCAAALTFLAPTSARAQDGINLSWDDCGTFGHELKSFACDTNSGSDVLYASVSSSVDLSQVNGVELQVIFGFTGPTASPWWHMEAGGCRAGSVTGRIDFTSAPGSCHDLWLGPGLGNGVDWQNAFYGPQTARLRAIGAISGTTVLPANTEAYVFAFVIDHAKTAGAGSCTGCSGDAACINLTWMKLIQPIGVGDQTFTYPLTRSSVSWKCSGFLTGGGGIDGPFACYANCLVPALKPSWGAIKSLYR